MEKRKILKEEKREKEKKERCKKDSIGKKDRP